MKEVELGNEPKELVEMKEIISGRKSLLDGLTSRIASTGDRISDLGNITTDVLNSNRTNIFCHRFLSLSYDVCM